jgi:hypothetical protein
MPFPLCKECYSVCKIVFTTHNYQCVKCGKERIIEDGEILDDTSYVYNDSSRLDVYKILGVYDPKVALIEKKCPKCVGKNMHLCRLVLADYSVLLKCKSCDYVL